MGLSSKWKLIMIYWNLIETQMIRSWCFVTREARLRSTNRRESETPPQCNYWEKSWMWKPTENDVSRREVQDEAQRLRSKR